jgi:excisionase family DNA binding protein
MRSEVIEEATESGGEAATDQPARAAYTVREVADLLGLSTGTTYALVRAGDIPARRMGGRWIVPKRRFHRWLDRGAK